MIYCQLKISSHAIKLLIESKGAIPNSYMHAFKDNLKLTNEVKQLSNRYMHAFKDNLKLKNEVKQLSNQNEQLSNEYGQLINEISQLID